MPNRRLLAPMPIGQPRRHGLRAVRRIATEAL